MDDDQDDQRPIDFRPARCFGPPARSDTPEDLFRLARRRGNTGPRFTSRSNPSQILVYADGACLNNGSKSAVGGCAFVFKDGEEGIVSFPLEKSGPSRIVHTHTSNRAELRAVIAILQFRAWNFEGYNQMVIATDSEYVVKGATEWVEGWVRRGWRTSQGTEAKNKDLWELLFKNIQRFRENRSRRLDVIFWRIPREWNTVADRGAKEAAREAASTGKVDESFSEILGVLV